MSGFGWAIASSVSNALGDPVRKYLGSKIRSPYLLMGIKSSIQLPVYGALAIYMGLPELSMPFVMAVLGSGVINFVTSVLYIRSLQLSPLSLTVPYLTFTPAFLLVVAFLMLGERTSVQGTLGVLIVSCGGFMLHASSAPEMKISSLYSFASNPGNLDRGSLYMITIAGMWSVSASFDKIGTQHSNSYAFAASVMLLHAILNLAWWWRESDSPDMLEVVPRVLCGDGERQRASPDRGVAEPSGEEEQDESEGMLGIEMTDMDDSSILLEVTTDRKGHCGSSQPSAEDRAVHEIQSLPMAMLLLFAVMAGLSYWLHLRASVAVHVSYAIAIKRAGCLVSLIVGKVFFGENNCVRRLPGVLVMLFGVGLIVLQNGGE